MKRWLLFTLLAAAPGWAGGDQVAPPSGCHEDFANCKETCTLEHGTSQNGRAKFSRCLGRCDQTHDLCIERFLEVNHNQLAPSAVEHDRGARDEIRSDPTPHASEPRTRYAADPEPAPAAEKPAAMPTPAPRASPAQEPEPEPAAAPPSSPPPQATAPPPPKPTEPPKKPKKDISEWDPNDLK